MFVSDHCSYIVVQRHYILLNGVSFIRIKLIVSGKSVIESANFSTDATVEAPTSSIGVICILFIPLLVNRYVECTCLTNNQRYTGRV